MEDVHYCMEERKHKGTAVTNRIVCIYRGLLWLCQSTNKGRCNPAAGGLCIIQRSSSGML